MSTLILNLITDMTLINKIKTIRLSKNLTQQYMADELGIDAANYSRLERGEVKISTDRIQEIAKILDIHVNVLLNDENEISYKEASSVHILKEILSEIKLINKKLNQE